MGKRRPIIKTAFLDSSVIFTAVNSLTGGSAKLFTLKRLKLTTSELVLSEVEKNVRNKLTWYHLERFFLLVKKLEITKQDIDKKIIEKAKKVTHPKDAIILAEGKRSGADFVVSLDKKHFFNDGAKSFIKPAEIVTPKDLLT